MSKVSLICNECGDEFYIDKRRYNYNIKKGQERFFCSRKCSSTGNSGRFIDGHKSNGRPRANIYSPFRRFLFTTKNNRSKKRNLDYNLTVEYLYDLWNSQSGLCALSGREMLLPRDSSDMNFHKMKSPWKASIDRLDNSKGYIQGNVRFISVIANYAKNIYSDDDVIEFCRSVSEYNK